MNSAPTIAITDPVGDDDSTNDGVAYTVVLSGADSDDAATIDRRMGQAEEEISHYVESDYLVVNEDFERALAELRAIITAERLRAPRQQQVLTGMLKGLRDPDNAP